MSENYFKEVIEKARYCDDIIKTAKGFGYDSLCLRYKIARENMARYEFETQSKEKVKDLDYFMKQAKRDELRFYEILDQLIGEHD